MSTQNKFHKVSILGVEVDAVSIEDAVEHIVQLADNKSSSPCYIVKPYVEFIDRARDPQINKILNGAYMSLPDGIALVWAAHYQSLPNKSFYALCKSLADIVLNPQKVRNVIPGTIAGINFTIPLLQAAATNSLRVYLIGSPRETTITKTAGFLKEHIPNLNIVGTTHGYLTAEEAETLSERLKNSRPDLVLVGMGFPRQEFLIQKLVSELEHGVLIGEGGSFDYRELGGKVKRAPSFVQKLGLEWLWRLILEPKRIKRQLAIPRFIWSVYTANRK